MKVVSVNRSSQKGTIKSAVSKINLNSNGVEGDTDAGSWHRQVSLLSMESIESYTSKLGRVAECGEFAEHITTQGVELHKLKPFDRLVFKDTILEITQIGNKCNVEGCGCEITSETGNCGMPTEAVFGRVLKSGTIQAGDEFTIEPKQYKCLIITMNDRASRAELDGKSEPLLQHILQEFFDQNNSPIIFKSIILPNNEEALMDVMVTSHRYDLIFTTGGTGIGRRDITVDVIKGFLDKEIPGIMELIRVKYGDINANMLLSRSVAGIKGHTLVFTLPENPKEIKEYLHEITKIIFQAFLMMAGIDRN